MTAKPSELDFASVLASSVHDMKNSLSMVMTTLDDIADLWRPSDAESVTKLGQLQYETKRLNSQLVQMLTLYKIGNNQCLVNIGEHDVAEFLQEATLPHREMLAARGITLTTNAIQGLSWFFDRNLIYGIINNVINNSCRYTRDRIEITARVEEDFLALRIADNGAGYPPAVLDKVDFSQSESSFTSGSTGLGLIFSQQVSALHQHRERRGYISLDNHGIDGGACFSLFLP
jgi:signal transduction histidine kinase